jgi:hypothetical protein
MIILDQYCTYLTQYQTPYMQPVVLCHLSYVPKTVRSDMGKSAINWNRTRQNVCILGVVIATPRVVLADKFTVR